jgi:hypothetical protein
MRIAKDFFKEFSSLTLNAYREEILMRKIACLLTPFLFLFVLGCGGGGQPISGGGSIGDGGGSTPPAGYGYITLDIRQGNIGASSADAGPLATIGSLPAADNVRIAARLVTTHPVEIFDEDGGSFDPPQYVDVTSEFYRKILNVSLPVSSPVSIAVPAADGYTVEVLSSRMGMDSGGNPAHILLKYGKVSGVNVAAGGSTSQSITAAPIADGLTITLPDNVIAGNRYDIPVAIDNVPLRYSFYFQQYVDNVSNSAPSGSFVNTTSPLFSVTPAFTAQSLTSSPSGQIFWDLYFQGIFFIDEAWKSDTDSVNWWKQWIFYYPNRNPGYTDPFLKMKLYPLGTVDIIVTL